MLEERHEIEVVEWREGLAHECSGGSRVRGAAAAASTISPEFLGRYATVMDAEMLAMAMSFEAGSSCVALDSQGAITKAVQLYTEPTRSWVEYRVHR